MADFISLKISAFSTC